MSIYDKVRGSYYKSYHDKLASRNKVNIQIKRLNDFYDNEVSLIQTTFTKIDTDREKMKSTLNEVKETNNNISLNITNFDQNMDTLIREKYNQLSSEVDTSLSNLNIKDYNVNLNDHTDNYESLEEWKRSMFMPPCSLGIRWFGCKVDNLTLLKELKNILHIAKLTSNNMMRGEDYINSGLILEIFISSPRGITWLVLGQNGTLGHNLIIKYQSKKPNVSINLKSEPFNIKKTDNTYDLNNVDVDLIIKFLFDENDLKNNSQSFIKIKTNLPYNSISGMANYYMSGCDSFDDYQERIAMNTAMRKNLYTDNKDVGIAYRPWSTPEDIQNKQYQDMPSENNIPSVVNYKINKNKEKAGLFGFYTQITPRLDNNNKISFLNDVKKTSNDEQYTGLFDILSGMRIQEITYKSKLVFDDYFDKNDKHNKVCQKDYYPPYTKNESIVNLFDYHDVGDVSAILKNENTFAVDNGIRSNGNPVLFSPGSTDAIKNENVLLNKVYNNKLLDTLAYNRNNKMTSYFTKIKGNNTGEINFIKETKHGIFITTKSHGIMIFDINNGIINESNIKSGNFGHIIELDDGFIAISTLDNNGIYKFDEETKTFIKTNIVSGSFEVLYKKDNTFYAISTSGDITYDPVLQNYKMNSMIFKYMPEEKNIKSYDNLIGTEFDGNDSVIRITDKELASMFESGTKITYKIVYFQNTDKFYILKKSKENDELNNLIETENNIFGNFKKSQFCDIIKSDTNSQNDIQIIDIETYSDNTGDSLYISAKSDKTKQVNTFVEFNEEPDFSSNNYYMKNPNEYTKVNTNSITTPEPEKTYYNKNETQNKIKVNNLNGETIPQEGTKYYKHLPDFYQKVDNTSDGEKTYYILNQYVYETVDTDNPLGPDPRIQYYIDDTDKPMTFTKVDTVSVPTPLPDTTYFVKDMETGNYFEITTKNRYTKVIEELSVWDPEKEYFVIQTYNKKEISKPLDSFLENTNYYTRKINISEILNASDYSLNFVNIEYSELITNNFELLTNIKEFDDDQEYYKNQIQFVEADLSEGTWKPDTDYYEKINVDEYAELGEGKRFNEKLNYFKRLEENKEKYIIVNKEETTVPEDGVNYYSKTDGSYNRFDTDGKVPDPNTNYYKQIPEHYEKINPEPDEYPDFNTTYYEKGHDSYSLVENTSDTPNTLIQYFTKGETRKEKVDKNIIRKPFNDIQYYTKSKDIYSIVVKDETPTPDPQTQYYTKQPSEYKLVDTKSETLPNPEKEYYTKNPTEYEKVDTSIVTEPDPNTNYYIMTVNRYDPVDKSETPVPEKGKDYFTKELEEYIPATDLSEWDPNTNYYVAVYDINPVEGELISWEQDTIYAVAKPDSYTKIEPQPGEWKSDTIYYELVIKYVATDKPLTEFLPNVDYYTLTPGTYSKITIGSLEYWDQETEYYQDITDYLECEKPLPSFESDTEYYTYNPAPYNVIVEKFYTFDEYVDYYIKVNTYYEKLEISDTFPEGIDIYTYIPDSYNLESLSGAWEDKDYYTKEEYKKYSYELKSSGEYEPAPSTYYGLFDIENDKYLIINENKKPSDDIQLYTVKTSSESVESESFVYKFFSYTNFERLRLSSLKTINNKTYTTNNYYLNSKETKVVTYSESEEEITNYLLGGKIYFANNNLFIIPESNERQDVINIVYLNGYYYIALRDYNVYKMTNNFTIIEDMFGKDIIKLFTVEDFLFINGLNENNTENETIKKYPALLDDDIYLNNKPINQKILVQD